MKIQKKPSPRERANDLEFMNKLTENSTLTERDVEEISHKIKKEVAKRFGLETNTKARNKRS